ncbi:MAG: VTC domain-containing protein [Ruminococcus sp.]|nr:VTC domain-containing protein [Ruminococcus sp.]
MFSQTFNQGEFSNLYPSFFIDFISAEEYIYEHHMPDTSQIMKEIDWTVNFYKGLKPKMFIAYDRCAYFGKEDENLRITFDMNLRYRTDDLSLSSGSHGHSIIDESLCIMEIKALKAMPMWLCDILNELRIYPSSFSKYGTAYKIISQKNGGYDCA